MFGHLSKKMKSKKITHYDAFDLVRKYALRKTIELHKMLDDLAELVALREWSGDKEKVHLLQHHYEDELRKEEHSSERVVRRLSRWLQQLEEVIERAEGEDKNKLHQVKEQIEISRNNIVKILAPGGELHSLVKEKANVRELQQKVREALGGKRYLGLTTLFAVLKWISHLDELDEPEPLYAGVIRIPPGYTPIKKLNPTRSYENLRILPYDKMLGTGKLSGTTFFIKDPHNKDLIALQERFKEDTKKLKRELQREAKRVGVPVRFTIRNKGCRKLAILLRPVFFESKEDKTTNTRWTSSDKVDSFVIHFDEDHTVQFVRYYGMPSLPSEKFKSDVAKKLEYDRSRKFLHDYYGHWRIVAKYIIYIIGLVIREENEISQSQRK